MIGGWKEAQKNFKQDKIALPSACSGIKWLASPIPNLINHLSQTGNAAFAPMLNVKSRAVLGWCADSPFCSNSALDTSVMAQPSIPSSLKCRPMSDSQNLIEDNGQVLRFLI